MTKVADLLNQQGSARDETKLQQAFSDDKVKEIKHIIVSGPGTEDYRAWNHTKSGVFSVRSGYHMGMCIKRAGKALATSSNPAADHKSFLELWSADVPNKMKLHTWHIISNGLAVGHDLHRRRIKPGVFCIACGREESLVHRFRRCLHSLLFWKLLRDSIGAPLLGLPKEIETYRGMRTWLLEWLGRACSEERETVITAWYELWMARME